MTRFEFEVTEVFDLAGRAVLAVVGSIRQGETRPGAILRDAATGHRIELKSIDVFAALDRTGDRVALIVARSERDYAQPGRLWIADDSSITPSPAIDR